MGTVYNRGTRARPNWYVAYKGPDGKRKTVPSHQPTKTLARQYLEQLEARVAAGLIGIQEPDDEPPCEALLTPWADGLRNRNARDDQNRMRRHLLPVFGDRPLSEITLPVVMRWLDKQRAARKLSDASIRHNLNLLSRFFSWAIERGHTELNPVRLIPTGASGPSRAARKTSRGCRMTRSS